MLKKYGVWIVKRGYVEIPASEMEIATGSALTLDDKAIQWEGREIESVEDMGPRNPEN